MKEYIKTSIVNPDFKVLYLIDNSRFGGAQTIALDVMKESSDNLIFFCMNKSEPNLFDDNTTVIYSKSKHRLSIKPLLEIIRIIKKKKIRIIHSNLFKSLLISIFLKILIFKNIKIIHHEHGQISSDNKLYITVCRYFNRYINTIISISNSVTNDIKQKCSIKSQKIIELPNPVSEEFNKSIPIKEKNKIKNEFGIDGNKIVIGYVGRLENYKGPQLLLDAFLEIKKNVCLIFIGYGSLENKLIKKCEDLSITDGVIFLGPQNRNKIPYYMACFDMVVIPSLREGFGLVAVESAMLKIPVIASRTGGLPDFIENKNNGLLFEPGNIMEISESVRYLIDNPDMAEKFKLNAYLKAQKYQLSKYLRSLNTLYNGITI